MKRFINAAATTLLCLASCQTCWAQFGDGITQQATPATSSSTPQALVVGTIPVSTFSDAFHSMSIESDGGVTQGVKVTAVGPFGLAQRNGLEKGDRILTLNGRRINTGADLQNALNGVRQASVPIEVVNVRNGQIQRSQYALTSEAGKYLTNFGTIELKQLPTGTQGFSVLEGTLQFKNGMTSQIKGTLSRNTFRGNSTMAGRAPAPFVLTKDGNLFDGTVTQGGQRRFVFIKM